MNEGKKDVFDELMHLYPLAGTLSTIRPGTFAGAFLALLSGSTEGVPSPAIAR